MDPGRTRRLAILLTAWHHGGVDVSAHIRGKLDLLACFASQHAIRDYLADDDGRDQGRDTIRVILE
ncbi:hypothetical protein [Actinophytocola sp.]|uniref:hypothetical protein n=1 Tax=Actinophytocola sp. TaxID=1872138 RepID=UPI002D7E44CF|nr:hypothetical protein [Actinophytocola sp.]HET9142971.1 hypothetical protein [Actinophytocola sp.]